MTTIRPSGEILGATVEGLDLSQPLEGDDVDLVVDAIGRYGVLRFPDQDISGAQLKTFSGRFGELEVNVANSYQGRPPRGDDPLQHQGRGKADRPAGCRPELAHRHVLQPHDRVRERAVRSQDPAPERRPSRVDRVLQHACGLRRPPGRSEGAARRQDGPARLQQVLGDDASREGQLPAAVDGSTAQGEAPVSHPVFLAHPITGRTVLYANPGYALRINGMSQIESDEILQFLFRHQTQDKYRYAFRWTERDVLMWESFGTIHNAVADYGPDEPRLIKRCQIMATGFAVPDGIEAA